MSCKCRNVARLMSSLISVFITCRNNNAVCWALNYFRGGMSYTMARRHISTLIDRKAINDINDNFKELFDEFVGAGSSAEEARKSRAGVS